MAFGPEPAALVDDGGECDFGAQRELAIPPPERAATASDAVEF